MKEKYLTIRHIGKFIFFTIFSLLNFQTYAQDIQFSQFYASPLYLNPGFAGSAHATRGIFHSRLQWPGIEGRYTTSLLSFDSYINSINSGVGIYAYYDSQAGIINSTKVSGLYAYELTIKNNLFFRPGIEIAYLNRSIDESQLIFSSQVTDNGIMQGDEINLESSHMVDVATGGILYSSNFWVGFSAHHVNRPNQSFTNDVSRLPVKYSAVAGYKINLKKVAVDNGLMQNKPMSLTPTAQYKFQGKSDQFDLGVYFLYDMYIIGGWYRGIPVKVYESDIHNNESVVILAGLKLQNFSVSYSYDWVISTLHQASPVGAHELNLTYLFNRSAQNKILKRLPCPSF